MVVWTEEGARHHRLWSVSVLAPSPVPWVHPVELWWQFHGGFSDSLSTDCNESQSWVCLGCLGAPYSVCRVVRGTKDDTTVWRRIPFLSQGDPVSAATSIVPRQACDWSHAAACRQSLSNKETGNRLHLLPIPNPLPPRGIPCSITSC